MRVLSLGPLLLLLAASPPGANSTFDSHDDLGSNRTQTSAMIAHPTRMFRGSLLLGLASLDVPSGVGEIGRVKSRIGTATVERGTTSIVASVGQELMPGDWLVTGKDGQMSLTFVDDTRFAVGPDSRIALKKFEYDPTTQKGSFIAKVERGSIAVVSGRISKSGRDGEQIETPDSVLDVNGTRFIVVVRK